MAETHTHSPRQPTHADRPGLQPSPTLSATCCLLATALLAFDEGGYQSTSRVLPSLLLLVSLAGILRLEKRQPSNVQAVTGAAIALGCWAVIRGITVHSSGGWGWLWTVAAFLFVFWTARSTRFLGQQLLAYGLVMIGIALALSAWVGLVFRVHPWAQLNDSVWQGATAITYSNAGGAVIAAVALLVWAETTSVRTRWLSIALWALLVGLGATLSRGAVASFLIGALFIAMTTGWKRSWATLRPALAAAGITLAGLAPSFLDTAHSPTRLPFAFCGLAGGLVWLSGRKPVRRVALACVCIALVSFPVQDGLRSLSAGPSPRLSVQSTERTHAAVAAAAVAATSPFIGVGPGRAVLEWTDQGKTRTITYAHNEYLQTLAELGLVGLGLAIALAGMLLRLTWPARNVDVAARGAGACAAILALLSQSAVDFLWHVPVIPLVIALVAGLHRQNATWGSTASG